MGYQIVRFTQKQYSIRNEKGVQVASVMGKEHAELFTRSWEDRNTLVKVRQAVAEWEAGSLPEDILINIKSIIKE